MTATPKTLLAGMGLASTSFLGAMLGKRSSRVRDENASNADSEPFRETKRVMSLPPVPRGSASAQGETVSFLEKAHALGAAGIQAQITGDVRVLRERAEKLGMWVEAMLSIRESSVEALEHGIVNAKEAGCTLARDGLLGGRRYETFDTLDEWEAWEAESRAKLEAAIPIFEKHKFTLALENHKDWTLEEYVSLFRTYASEYFGACLDLGNNLALLDGLFETVEAAAPYAKAVHFKDVAVAPDTDGFLLAEVPLGSGVLDLPRILELLARSNPGVHLALEMITRDPLKVPCLGDHYWQTFPDRRGICLARALRYVNEQKRESLPNPENLPIEEHLAIEEENVRACFQYANSFGS